VHVHRSPDLYSPPHLSILDAYVVDRLSGSFKRLEQLTLPPPPRPPSILASMGLGLGFAGDLSSNMNSVRVLSGLVLLISGTLLVWLLVTKLSSSVPGYNEEQPSSGSDTTPPVPERSPENRKKND
jgi:hypothetical protein